VRRKVLVLTVVLLVASGFDLHTTSTTYLGSYCTDALALSYATHSLARSTLVGICIHRRELNLSITHPLIHLFKFYIKIEAKITKTASSISKWLI
jgi:hypothetical protein